MKEVELKSQAELYALIQNKTRKALLQFIYQQPRTYTDLIDHTNLKPGSLYHHLKVMERLVEKRDHGLYGITNEGAFIVNSLDMVKEKKPKLTEFDPDTDRSSNDRSSTEAQQKSKQEPNTKSISPEDANSQLYLSPTERINQIIWLGIPNLMLLGGIFLLVVLLAIEGVAIAGIAIYAAPAAGIFATLAFVLGTLGLYYIEQLVFSLRIHHSFQFAVVIRIMSMLPASIVGLVMYLLFLVGLVASTSAWVILFVISSVMGYGIIVLGLQYLQGLDGNHASLLSVIPASIDLLIGLTILLIQ